MPSGRVHDVFNLTFLMILLFVVNPAFLIADPSLSYYFAGGFIAATIFLSPDMDLMQSKPKKRWGLLSYIWYPYSYLSDHRGLSHIPVLGLTIRIVYLGIFVAIVVFALKWAGIWDFTEKVKITPAGAIFILIGAYTADTLHILLDYIHSSIKNWKKKRQRKKKEKEKQFQKESKGK